MACSDCASTATTRRKGRTALGYRRFRCQACRRRFNERTGTPFNDLQYPTDIVLLAVLWRLRYKLGFRDVAELLLERGFEVTHETIRAWEVRFATLLADQLRAKRRGQAGGSWYLDKTYVKVAGRWCYLYRAIDREGVLLDSMRSEHRDKHAARRFLVRSFPTTRAGHRALLAWLRRFGAVERVGVEGTGSYGAGLARFLHAEGVTVVEVNRPNRQLRRSHGKSDPVDAVAAARAAQSGQATGQAKTRDGAVEAIRALRVARRSARHGRITAINQMRALLVSGPDDLRETLRGSTVFKLVTTAARLRPADPTTAAGATRFALRELARRVQSLEAECKRLDALLESLVSATAPELVASYGVGTDTAGALFVSAGDNPQRLHSEAAFAHLCGVAPIDASSGLTLRKRLNRGGDRTANQALWRIVMVRMVHDPRTRRYVERRTREGRSKREIIRSLKRYVARQLYRYLPRPESLA